MRKIDADHMLLRLSKPKNAAEAVIYEAWINFINEEESVEEPIDWVASTKEKRTKDCHSISHGYKCSKCGQWEELKSRYCKGCGGHFDGKIEKINEKVWRFNNGNRRKS